MPGDLGLVATAMTTIVIIEAILDLPIAPALLRGVVIAPLLRGLGWPVAWFYGHPQLVLVIAILSLVPIMKGLANPRADGADRRRLGRSGRCALERPPNDRGTVRMQIGSFIGPVAGLVGVYLAYHSFAPCDSRLGAEPDLLGLFGGP
jgi:hypothetical protein